MQKPYHHGDLRQALVAKTLELVRNREEDKIGIRELARQLNVSRTAPYRHFKNVEEIFSEVIKEGYQLFVKRLREAQRQQYSSLTEEFIELGVAYVSFAIQNPSHYRLMFDSKYRQHSADIENLAHDSFAILKDTVRRCLPTERKQDDQKYATIAWAYVHGLADLMIGKKIGQKGHEITFIRESCRALLELPID